MSLPLKSSQVISIAAVTAALLGGAYAIGRSQGATPSADAAAEPTSKVAASSTHPNGSSHATPQTLSAGDSRHEADRLARLCEGCALVTDVHTETRRGQGTGVGAVGGAVVGGLLGNMIGGGNGKKLATVGGAVAGGYAGNEIEKRERSYQVWVVQVKQPNGQTRRFERSADPGVRTGDQVALRPDGFSLI